MILVLSGTKDGREIVTRLSQLGRAVLATTVTGYGKGLIQKNNEVDVVDGGLDAEELAELIKEKNINMVVDATHPFAQQVSKMAMEVCNKLNCTYLRYEREETHYQYEQNLIVVDSFFQAARQAAKYEGKVFLTVGSNNLHYFCREIPVERLIARVLPLSSVMKKCEELGFNPGSIVALQGPFNKELNKNLFLHYQADIVVTKDSGKIGGVEDKLEAAKELNIPVIMIKRPALNYERVVRNIDELLQVVENILV